MARLGPLAQAETVGGELGEGVVAQVGTYCIRVVTRWSQVAGSGSFSPLTWAARTAAPGSRRSPVTPWTASVRNPAPSPAIRTCRSYGASRIGTVKRTPRPRMKSLF